MTTITNRFNTLLLVLLVLMAGAIITMLATRAYGGPLDPTGPPASTDGVLTPGTPISSLPFATTQGGYYYVTRALSALAGQSGITICCSNTTVDLGGFTITGAGVGMSPGDGISNPGARNIVIRNGAVRGWFNGINLGGTDSRVDGVQASSNTVNGIKIGAQSEISDCNVSLNGQLGIDITYGTVRNCTATENDTGIVLENNALVEDSHVNSNRNVGISTNADNNTVRNNELSGNRNFDISVFGTGNVVRENVYCSLSNAGTNTIFTGNVDRIDAC